MYWCYVIYSETRRYYYIGVTDDAARRVQDHTTKMALTWARKTVLPTQKNKNSWQASYVATLKLRQCFRVVSHILITLHIVVTSVKCIPLL